jgi:hypothetical protein
MERGGSEETVSVPCPDCGQGSEEPVRRVATLDVIPCSLCGGLIDLSAKECRAVVGQAKARLADARRA